MTKLICYFAAVAMICFMFADISMAQTELLSEDFETGQRAPNGWKQGASLPGVEYIYEKGMGSSGDRCLSLQKSAKRYFPIAQWFRVMRHNSALTAIDVSAQVSAEDCTKAVLDVQFLKANGDTMSHEWIALIGGDDGPANHDWKAVSKTVTIPNGTKKIMFGFQIYGPGKVWFDDLKANYVDSNSVKDTEKDKPEVLDNMVEVAVGKKKGNYLLVAPKDETPPANGYGMLIVLPGGDGSADFHPFVSSIHANSLGSDFILVQPLAKQWTKEQVIVWPTAKSRVKKMGYTTEKLIQAVINDVAEKSEVDPDRIYMLGWSSGGPAVYATVMRNKSPIAGAMVAMSVFKPKQLPKPKYAEGKSVYILHSPEDRVCPYWMAEAGSKAFADAGVRSNLVDYDGGHGWHGDVFGNIEAGMAWLESAE